jgi:VanZ family protein
MAVMTGIAALLEALQLLTPDRSANVLGAIYSVVGALAAALFAELVIRARRHRFLRPRQYK